MHKQGNTKPSRSLPFPQQKLSASDTTTSSPVVVPTPTSLEEPDPDDNVLMETSESSNAAAVAEAVNGLQTQQEKPAPADKAGEPGTKPAPTDTKSKPKTKSKKKSGPPTKRKSNRKEESSESESSDDSDSSDSDSNDSESEDELLKKRKKKAAAKKAAEKKAKLKAKAKAKKGKSKKQDSSDDSSSSSDSDSDSESEDDKIKRKKKAKAKAKAKKSKKAESSSDDSTSSSSSSSDSSDSEDEKKKKKKKRKAKAKARAKKAKAAEADSSSSSSDSDAEAQKTPESTPDAAAAMSAEKAAFAAHVAAFQEGLKKFELSTAAQQTGHAAAASSLRKKDVTPPKKKNALEFKRLDQVWDSKIRDYKYTESAEEQKDEFDCVFTVRRRFGWDNKYIETQVDIKSKLLRNVLQVIFKDCKSISLVEDTPSIHPHNLFLYYDEITHYIKKTLKPQLKRTKKSKEKKQLEAQIAQCKLLARFIDEDYEETRKTLKPMLKAGTITYNLVWALFKPNRIAYTPTYGNKDDPRCVKVDSIYEEVDWFENRKWLIEGRYLEYDGKVFGLGDHCVAIPAFKGPRKIANLAAYPLDFHKDPEGLREQLIERGKKFVALQGMNYRFHKGLGYMKQKRSVAKININGRVMIDPAIFRRINPNYLLSYIKQDEIGQEDPEDEDDSDDGSNCGCSDADDESEKDEEPKMRLVMWRDKKGKKHLIRVPAPDKGADITAQRLDAVKEDSDERQYVFTEEELLIASPVVLGFAFSEKYWLEFSLSGIKEIEWNSEAFDTLVLPKHIKQNLKGLVSSHRFNAAKTIDDVIVGKGKGLNVVLHGPPGVGKTLTGESIAEYLRCPLYAVSAGELGTNSRSLEQDLNRIMDITHSWGAILLLDEADVFLEARQPHDIHRNSLVSVFLRLTEYYQGILFLTTNRVATFDEAFQSRIHMGIRYENLTAKARKKIWQHHVGKVLEMTGDSQHKSKPFDDSDFDELSKKVMNGRQIKNTVKTSQSIAVAEEGVFNMGYIKRVLEVAETFEEDMRGGLGYRDAMRQYT